MLFECKEKRTIHESEVQSLNTSLAPSQSDLRVKEIRGLTPAGSELRPRSLQASYRWPICRAAIWYLVPSEASPQPFPPTLRDPFEHLLMPRSITIRVTVCRLAPSAWHTLVNKMSVTLVGDELTLRDPNPPPDLDQGQDRVSTSEVTPASSAFAGPGSGVTGFLV